MDWQQCCVRKQAKLVDVLQVLNKTAMQAVLVTDGDGRLHGIITDGDVRRALLKGMDLDCPAERFMNRHPLSFQQSHSQSYVISQMQKRRLTQAPILNEDGTVVGLYRLGDLLVKKRRDNVVIVMAGGLGTRLRPLTNDCPKPLLKVGNKPILETILENFIAGGFYRFYFAVNYKYEMIQRYFGDGSRWDVEISYLLERKRMGTAGALSLLPEEMKDSVIVMNGDLLTKVDFGEMLDFHKGQEASATMAVREYSYQVPYGVVESDGYQIVRIVEKPVQSAYVNAGIYVLNAETIAGMGQDQFMDMPDLFGKLILEKKKVLWYPIQDYWMDIGRMDDLERAQHDYSDVFKTENGFDGKESDD